ncbi:MAG: DUF2142 domain-containing protein [Saccharofermentans sp.]|nr:DUF2142 domain-containing protein [Saccharofermentans sp.]
MNSPVTTKTKYITIIMAAFLTVAFAAALSLDLLPRIRKEAVVKGITSYTSKEIAPGQSMDLEFSCNRSGFDHLVFFVMDGDPTSLSFCLTDKDNGNELLKTVRITTGMCSPEGKAMSIRLSSDKRLAPGSYVAKISNVSDSPVSINITKDDGFLNVRLLVSTSMGTVSSWAVCCLLILFAGTSLYFFLKNDSNYPFTPERFFIITAIPLCLAAILLIPPWSTGDSEAHYLACYRLSNLFLGQGQAGEWMGRTDDVLFYRDIWWNSTPPSTGGLEILKSNFRLLASDKSLIPMTAKSVKMNYYSVFCYIPQTFALVIGRLLGLGTVANCYLAKLLTAAFYIVLCYRAIKKAPCGRFVIALCAVLPSSLMMSNAFSYDPMVLITSLNFISSVLLLRQSPDDKKALAFTSIWAFMLGAVKGGGYLILLPILFMIPSSKKGLKFANKLIPLICGIVSVITFDMLLPSQELFQFGSKGNGFMTASFAIENPLAYLKMTILTYGRFVGDMTADLFGSKLCWGEQVIPLVFSIGMFIILVIISADDAYIDSLKTKDILIALAVVLIALLTTPSMLLSWTPEGSDVILGIQGHYFLPVLPLFAMSAGKGLRVLARKITKGNTGTVKAIASAAYPCTAFMLVLAFYFIMRLYLSR